MICDLISPKASLLFVEQSFGSKVGHSIHMDLFLRFVTLETFSKVCNTRNTTRNILGKNKGIQELIGKVLWDGFENQS